MIRTALGALAAALLLLVPATAQGDSASNTRVRGAVVSKTVTTHRVSVRSAQRAVALHVPGTLAAIRVGQRVELRGSTLRAADGRSRVLARHVTVIGSATSAGDLDDQDDDEVEMKGKLTSLSPVTVESGARTVSCVLPAGFSLAGFAVGDLVELTCDLKAGAWVVRKLEHEDDADEDHGGSSGPGSADDDDDHDDDHDGTSGPDGGDDD